MKPPKKLKIPLNPVRALKKENKNMDNQEITQITDSQVEENIFGNEGLDPFVLV